MTRIRAGLAWFTPEQWPEVQRTMEDKARETFAHWLRHAKKVEAKLKKDGHDVVRLQVDIGEFEIWAARKQKKKNAAARAEYVLEKLKKL